MTAPTPGAPDVAELRRLLAAGHTPLPWTVFTETQGYPDDGMLYIEEMEITLGPESYPVNVADANLIAGVSLLPALLDRLDALEAVAEAARAHFEATAREPIEGGPPTVEYVRERDAIRREVRGTLQRALGIADDPPRWSRAALDRLPR